MGFKMKSRKKQKTVSVITIAPLSISKRKAIKKREKKILSDDTPVHIMKNALSKIYGIDITDKFKYNAFIEYLMKNLSLLSK